MSLYDIYFKIDFKIHRQRYAADLKPRYVFWYLLAKGDQKLIGEFAKTNFKVKNKRLWRELMDFVNLEDYAFCLEKDFKKYCDNEYTFVVKKKADN